MMKRLLFALLIAGASLSAAAGSLPEWVDNSSKEYFPPVFSQIGGSCAQASAVGYVFTYEMNSLLERSAASAENRFSYLFTWNFLNDGTDDGSLGWDGILLSYKSGMMTEADFPYQSAAHQFCWASGYDKYLRALHYKATAVTTMELTNEQELEAVKEYLYNEGKGHLVSFSSAARNWKFDSGYSGPSATGYHCLLTSLPTDGAHAMTIVGYDDTVECNIDGRTTYGAFIVVNSYGAYYHDRGFYYLPYRFFLEPLPSGAILAKSVFGVSVEYYEPRLVFKVNVDYTSRNDIDFILGVADGPAAENPTAQVVSSIANFQGGDHPMCGRYGSSEIELALDATSIADKAAACPEPKYFLRIDRKNNGKGGEGRLLGFEVHDLDNDKSYTYTADGTPLKYGVNIYGLATTLLRLTSASHVEWLNRDGSPAAAPLVVRTAKGKYAKIRITAKGDEISFKYVYAPGGSAALGN